jgi:hypothetical protein
MGFDDYKSGFDAGQRGQYARPPFDPRDPMSRKRINTYNWGYDKGTKAICERLDKPVVQIMLPSDKPKKLF